MENYKKGKNVEEPIERDSIPIANLPFNFLWMHVRGGTKLRNVLSHAINEFPSCKNVVWTGFGPSVNKAVTCAEIMKKEFKNTLHQITRICYRTVEEYWDPLLPELDQIVVKRKLPMIHIYLSEEALNTQDLGYQPPGVFNPHSATARSNNSKPNNKNKRNKPNFRDRQKSKKDAPHASNNKNNT